MQNGGNPVLLFLNQLYEILTFAKEKSFMSFSDTLPQAVCVNCNLSTRSDIKKCLHGDHPWATKMVTRLVPRIEGHAHDAGVFAKVGKQYPKEEVIQ